MTTVRYYLAGPMRGYPNFNFDAFDAASDVLVRLGTQEAPNYIYSPAQRDRVSGFNPVDYTGYEDLSTLGFDLRHAMADNCQFICQSADAIVVLPKWHWSAGARAEVAIGLAINLAILMICYDSDGDPYLEDISVVAHRTINRAATDRQRIQLARFGPHAS